jgi:hypothetical protein
MSLALTNFQCGMDAVRWYTTLGSCSNISNSSAPRAATSVSMGHCTPTAPRNGVTYYYRLAEYRKPCQYRGECRTWVILTFHTSSECFAT